VSLIDLRFSQESW